ncbi:hypothetical protein A3L25_000425 [Pseudomonas putida]|uniref:Uncharacterized protein n=1 Tax=Pseudomonas putida TaxID=303 RepID=A0AAP9SLM3_PSEPU|nr:hypothetical protein [Pseudomonas putida]QJQ07954.1 hypothetical protein A3L25_000425 [Pseudomonas putida]UVL78592.1 hypothetical protein LOY24_00130 [Pseudomonas putida]
MHSINRSGARRPRNGNQALALVSVVSRKSSAARAAHRRQASSHICFGPITPVLSSLPALFLPFDIEGIAAATTFISRHAPRVRAPKVQE